MSTGMLGRHRKIAVRLRVDWYDLGERWRAARDGLGHGDIEPALEQFAADNLIAANTLRRCHSGAATVRRLAAAGMGTIPELARLPLKTVSALQRLIRYGNAAVEPVVAAVLAEPTMSGARVAKLEAEARAREERSAEPNKHLARLDAKGFERAALAAMSERMANGGMRLAVIPARSSFAPFSVDAVVFDPTGAAIAVQVLASIAGPAARPRVSEALMRALAATKVFDLVVMLVGSDDDADWLASVQDRVGAGGVIVARYNEDGGLDQLDLPLGRTNPRTKREPPPFRHAYEQVLEELAQGDRSPRRGRGPQ